MRRSLVIYDFAPDPSEFPNMWGKFYFLFYQCTYRQAGTQKQKKFSWKNRKEREQITIDVCSVYIITLWLSLGKPVECWKISQTLPKSFSPANLLDSVNTSYIQMQVYVYTSRPERAIQPLSPRIEKIFMNVSVPLNRFPSLVKWQKKPEPVFVNVYGAQESIPRNRFRQPM